jgi:GNAT superfamily N-acetyltransferase
LRGVNHHIFFIEGGLSMIRLKFKLWAERNIESLNKVFILTEFVKAMIFIESNQVHNLGRIFIDPKYQNQGIGKKVMKEIEGSFPDSTKWWLDTPSWSVKNHHFYTMCGFTKVREEDDLYIFEKTV